MPSHLFCSMKLLLSRTNFNCTLVYAGIVWCIHLPASAVTSNSAVRATAAVEAGRQVFAVIAKAAATVSLYDGWVN